MRPHLGTNVAQYTSPQPTSPQFLADLDRAVALRMNYVRLDIVPAYTNLGLDLAQPAAKIAAAHSRGLHVHAMLPHWTTTDKVQHKDSGTLDDLATFAGRVVDELGHRISSWELGNEPDITTFAPDGADPEYQAAVTTAMVSALPKGAHICSPGLAPASDGGGNLSPITFATRYWAALDSITKSKLHANGIHLYGTPKDIGQSWSTYHQLPRISKAAGGRPLDVTESNGDPNAGPDVMAVQYADALAWLDTTSIPINRIFFYELSTQGPELPYGAYDGDGTPQPLLAVLQSWQQRKAL